ncbi:MAG: hypothetical protein ACK4YU_05780, partial [Paracoccus sp. (in: a-proteobacteria)]
MTLVHERLVLGGAIVLGKEGLGFHTSSGGAGRITISGTLRAPIKYDVLLVTRLCVTMMRIVQTCSSGSSVARKAPAEKESQMQFSGTDRYVAPPDLAVAV